MILDAFSRFSRIWTWLPEALMVKMCIYKGKSPSLPWSQITSSDSNDFIIQALTPLDAIVYESGAFGGVPGARGGA